MRITLHNREIIRQTAAEVFGPDVRVRVFGSRVDDNAKGGDLDLLVESNKPVAQSRRKVLKMVAKLQLRLGDQPIDVLVVDPETIQQPVHEAARQSGMVL